MAIDRDWWLLFPKPLRRVPGDLAVVIGLTAFIVMITALPVVRESPIRILGLLLVLLLPGYAIVAALFPTRPRDQEGVSGHDIDWFERLALSFGTSIAIVPLLGLLISLTPWGFTVGSVVSTLAGVTVGFSIVAVFRRWSVPPQDRFRVPFARWKETVHAETIESADRRSAVVNISLGGSILMATGMITYAIAFPRSGERFSDFYILTEDADGELVAAGYPTEFVLGDSEPIVVGVENTEREPVTYTVVVQLQRLEDAARPQDASVIEREELDRFSNTVAYGGTWHQEHHLAPTMTGEELRVVYMLYLGSPPPEPTRENAYRDLHLWITVR